IDLPKTVENAQPIPALLVNMTFDNENATVTEGIQTSVYGLDWQLPALDTDLIISEIVLQEPLPFDFSMEFRQPLEPCGDEFSVVFNYVADGQSTVFTSPEPFRFYNCPKCLEAVILKYKEGTYSDAEITNKIFPGLGFKMEAEEEEVTIPELVRLGPIHVYGDGFMKEISSLTNFIQYALFTNYDEEKESGQHLMEFEFEPDWSRVEQGKVVFRDIEVNEEGERQILSEMNWTWEIKGAGKIALFDENGDRYDVLFTSKTFVEDDSQIPHIQFEWKGKTFTSEALSSC
ncbi:MAG: hypothetical protein AB8B69_14500, partial [Chitinophagales bacterium]